MSKNSNYFEGKKVKVVFIDGLECVGIVTDVLLTLTGQAYWIKLNSDGYERMANLQNVAYIDEYSIE